jgi:tRNA (cmo5U34)-methyltransferase
VHHLRGAAKADLFARVAAVLAPGGRFVVGDVVVPEDPADAVTPLGEDYDFPSRVDEQLGWLGEAGFDASVVWRARDLAVVVARTAAG